MDKKLNLKTVLLIVLMFIFLIGGYYFYSQKKATVPSMTEPTPGVQKPKNPTISNFANDLTGSNDLESIGLIWNREAGASEYVLFRSESIGGPFTELNHLPAGGEHRTNATDFTPDARTKTLCYKIEARDASGKTMRVYEPVCVPKWQDKISVKIKNPTVSNSAGNLVGNNNLEAIGLTWTREERAAEYVLFRSDSIGGTFTEIGRIPAGFNRGTNAEDITTDAKIKTLCYKIEARDVQGKTIRVYEPVCVPKWQEELGVDIKNPTVNNPKNDFGGTNIGDTIYFSWGPVDRAAEYVLFKSLSIQGPWEEKGHIPASLTNAVDVTPDARLKTLCYHLEAHDTQGRVVRNYEPICVPKYEEEDVKNPTISNMMNDLRGSNYLEGVGLTWTRDERAVEYVLFRSDSLSGPFAELSHLPAGGERRTNATDFTPGARIKTLCYKLEARDASGKTIRVYEPVCVPKWQE